MRSNKIFKLWYIIIVICLNINATELTPSLDKNEWRLKDKGIVLDEQVLGPEFLIAPNVQMTIAVQLNFVTQYPISYVAEDINCVYIPPTNTSMTVLNINGQTKNEYYSVRVRYKLLGDIYQSPTAPKNYKLMNLRYVGTEEYLTQDTSEAQLSEINAIKEDINFSSIDEKTGEICKAMATSSLTARMNFGDFIFPSIPIIHENISFKVKLLDALNNDDDTLRRVIIKRKLVGNIAQNKNAKSGQALYEVSDVHTQYQIIDNRKEIGWKLLDSEVVLADGYIGPEFSVAPNTKLKAQVLLNDFPQHPLVYKNGSLQCLYTLPSATERISFETNFAKDESFFVRIKYRLVGQLYQNQTNNSEYKIINTRYICAADYLYNDTATPAELANIMNFYMDFDHIDPNKKTLRKTFITGAGAPMLKINDFIFPTTFTPSEALSMEYIFSPDSNIDDETIKRMRIQRSFVGKMVENELRKNRTPLYEISEAWHRYKIIIDE